MTAPTHPAPLRLGYVDDISSAQRAFSDIQSYLNFMGVLGFTLAAGTGLVSTPAGGFNGTADVTFSVNGAAISVPAANVTSGTFGSATSDTGVYKFTNNVVVGGANVPATLTALETANSVVMYGTSVASSGSVLKLLTQGTGSSVIIARYDGASPASPATLGSVENIGNVTWQGYDGSATSLQSGSQLLATTTQAWTGTAHGTKLLLKTVPNGSTTLTTALTLDQDQSATFAGTITSGLINGQTISSAANFTGGVAIAGNLSLTTNNTKLQGKTSGGSTVNLLVVTNDATNLTRYYVADNAGAFQWTDQGATTQWAALTSLGFTTNALTATTGTFSSNVFLSTILQNGAVDITINTSTGTQLASWSHTSGKFSQVFAADIAGDFSVNTNKFTVTASSGNTVSAGSYTSGTVPSSLSWGFASVLTTPAAAVIRGAGLFVSNTTGGGTHTMDHANGVYIANWSKGTGDTITEQVGVEIADMTSGTANYAIKTGLGQVKLGDALNLMNYTVGTLPTGVRGHVAYCTDLLAPGFLTIAVGGGAVVGPVFYNGSNWVAF